MQTKFSSFEQIDTQLEMLRVQRQLSLYRLKSQLGQSPAELLMSGWKYGLMPYLKMTAIDWSLHRLRKIRQALRPLQEAMN
jgi:hypothetical protein